MRAADGSLPRETAVIAGALNLFKYGGLTLGFPRSYATQSSSRAERANDEGESRVVMGNI